MKALMGIEWSDFDESPNVGALSVATAEQVAELKREIARLEREFARFAAKLRRRRYRKVD